MWIRFWEITKSFWIITFRKFKESVIWTCSVLFSVIKDIWKQEEHVSNMLHFLFYKSGNSRHNFHYVQHIIHILIVLKSDTAFLRFYGLIRKLLLNDKVKFHRYFRISVLCCILFWIFSLLGMSSSGSCNSYCGWLKFRGVPIFVVFVEGPIHEFQYPWNGNFLYELWKKILWPQILNPTNVSFFFNPRKLVPTKMKPSTVLDLRF